MLDLLGGTIGFLDVVWGEESCFVDLPTKYRGHWMPWIAQWPEDRVLVRRRIESSLEDGEDIYFSVAKFSGKGRRLVDALPTAWLWADLDRVDPVFLDEDGLLPTLAWESSPGRYQALWKLTRDLPPTVQTKLNRRLSLALAADKGGWDLTQVLRPPGTQNFKYNPVADVELMWYDEQLAYTPATIRDLVKTVEADRDERPQRVRSVSASRRLPTRARRLLNTPPEMVVVGERSARLWELEMLLAEAGLGEEEIFDLVWVSAWNKWRELRTGEDRLRKEITKAVKEANGVRKALAPKEKEKPKSEPKIRIVSPFVDYATFISSKIETPRWLIENIWSAASHGMIGGEPKTSKSTFTLAMALSVATGKPFLGLEEYDVPNPGPVLLIQEENAPWVVQDRLRKIARFYGLLGKHDVEISEAPAGSIVEHVITLDFPTEAPLKLLNNFGFNLTEQEDMEMLEEEVRKEGAAMVIIDPLYLVAGDTNLNNSHEIGPILQWLMALRHNHDCAVAVVHHWAKANENSKLRRSGQRLMGSALFHGWLESGLYMEKLDTDQPEVLRVKVEREFRNVAPQTDLELAWFIGEPGELDFNVEVVDWNAEGEIKSLVMREIETLLPTCDERGLNLKRVAAGVGGLPNDVGDKQAVARIAKELGYKVSTKKYPNGNAYIIYPTDARRNGGAS